MKSSTNIIRLSKTSLLALKSLRSDHLDNLILINSSDSNNELLTSNEEKSRRLKKSLEKIELGIDEIELILSLSDYFEIVEANQMKLNSMIDRLSEENIWLREEISATQSRLNASEEQNIELESQIKDYELKSELKKYDQPLSSSYSSSQISDQVNLSESTISGGNFTESLYNEINCKKNGSKSSKTNDSKNSNCPENLNMYSYELPDHLKSLHSLVTDYSNQGRFEVAMALCKQAIQNEMNNLSLKKQLLTENDNTNEVKDTDLHSLDIAILQNIFALVYRDQGNYVEAVNLLNKSLSVREKLLGTNHPLIAITLNNIAILQAKNGKLREAETMCRRALAIREQHLGSNHPDVAKQLFNLALLCQNQGRYEEVEQIYKKALSIYADNYGADNINVMKTRNNIAYVHLKQNNFLQAEIIFKELLTCWHERLVKEDQLNVVFPKKPLWVLVEDKSLFGSGQILKNSTEIQKLLPLYSLSVELPKEEFDLFSSTISYLIRAYKAQGKLCEADLLEDWLSRSIKQYSESIEFSCENCNDWSTSLTTSVYSDNYFIQPFSPSMRSNKGASIVDTSSETSSKYSLRRISNKISSKFKSIRSQVISSPEDNEFLISTKNSNSHNCKEYGQKC